MRLFRQSEEPQTTEQYVSDLTRQLRRDLPLDKAEQIAQETHAHLTDHVDDLTGAGLTRAQAEAQAVAGFGSARAYARTAIAEVYGDRTSARWRLVARIGAANFLAFNVLYTLYPGNYEPLWILGAAAGGLTVPLFALASRRPQTRHLLALSLLTLLSVGIGAGLRYVPNGETAPIEIARYNSPTQNLHGGPGIVRSDHSREVARLQTEARLMHEEAALLRQGVAVYKSQATVPETLRRHGRFIVPRSYQDHLSPFGGDAVDTSAFKDFQFSSDHLGEYREEINRLPFQTVATRQEARVLWADNGVSWLRAKQKRIAYRDGEIATLENAARAPLGFNGGAATYHATFSLWLCLGLIVLDFVLAHLGRWAWIHARNFRNGQFV